MNDKERSAIASDKERAQGFTDDRGTLFSKGGKKLLRCEEKDFTSFSVPQGTKTICSEAFSRCRSLKKVFIPSSVTLIGNAPFKECESLAQISVSPNNEHFCFLDGVLYSKDMTELISFPPGKNIECFAIPQGVTSVREYAFEDCSRLKSVTVPQSMALIGQSAFENCSSLAAVTMPESVTGICDYAFQGCDSLASISMPETLAFIGEEAFAYCKSLKSITIPQGVTSIGDRAFIGCLSLESFSFPGSLTRIGYNLFVRCDSIKHLAFGQGIRQIREGVLSGCPPLDTLILPESLTTIRGIDSDDDYSNIELPSITVLASLNPSPPKILNDQSFIDDILRQGTLLRVPKGSKQAYAEAPGWDKFHFLQEID